MKFKKATKKTDYYLICKNAIALAKKTNNIDYAEDNMKKFIEEYKTYEEDHDTAQHLETCLITKKTI